MSDELPVRIVGRRKPPTTGGLKAADNLLWLVRDWWEGRPYVPKGLYRFKSHEEADEWMMKMLTRPSRAPRPVRMSSPSPGPSTK